MATNPLSLSRKHGTSSGEDSPIALNLFVRNTFIEAVAVTTDISIQMPLQRSRSAPTIVVQRSPPVTLGGPVGSGNRDGPTDVGANGGGEPEGSAKSAEASNRLVDSQKKTTVILHNLPYLLSRSAFLEMLDSSGLHGGYDLVYFPRDFTMPGRQGLGYAFVNLSGGQAAAHRLFEVFQGRSEWPVLLQVTPKVCQVSWASRQGLGANVAYFRNSSLLLDPSVPEDCKPVLFQQGWPVPFPPPTRKAKCAAKFGRHRQAR